MLSLKGSRTHLNHNCALTLGTRDNNQGSQRCHFSVFGPENLFFCRWQTQLEALGYPRSTQTSTSLIPEEDSN